MLPLRKLSAEQQEIVRAIADGGTLKSHRYLDGRKIYRLHPLHGEAYEVDPKTIDDLRRRGLLDSNKKFPAATYLLTQGGRRLATELAPAKTLPLSPQNFETEHS